MSKHTPGPYHVAVEDRRALESRCSVWGPQSDAPLAVIPDGPTAQADAHLFAAAPDLLQACRSALGVLYASKSGRKEWNKHSLIAIGLLESAIQKAEGGGA